LLPPGDPITEVLRPHVDLLNKVGPEVAFDRRPARVEVWFETLCRPKEAEVSGTMDAILEQEEKLARRATTLPRQERVRYYAAELRNIDAYMEVGVRSYARRVRASTLVLHGDRDQTIPPSWSEELAELIPNAELQMIADGYHGLLFNNAKARRTLVEFVRSQETTR
jgi:fermentation-respiration switch protein FrsA (DUF1100 family)